MDTEELYNFLKLQSQPVMEITLFQEFYPHYRDLIFNPYSITFFTAHFTLYNALYRLAVELENRNDEHILFIRLASVYLLLKPGKGNCCYFDEDIPGFCGSEHGNPGEFCDRHEKEVSEIHSRGDIAFITMRDYYLDFDNMHAMTEDKLKTLSDGFWKYIYNFKQIDWALNIFSLDYSFSLFRLKERYRYLSKKHHPDVSENRMVSFEDISQAYRILRDFRGED